MKFFTIKYISTVFIILTFLVSPLFVGAATTNGFGQPTSNGTGQQTANGAGQPNSNMLVNPLGVSNFAELIKKILNAAIVIGIPIAVLFIVYAGFKFVWAQGNPKELGKARQNFMWTIVGIAIFVGASLIAGVIISTLQQLGVKGL